ncbi:MAG: HYR domain-containing protein, partial [Acidobacteriales bacterium]
DISQIQDAGFSSATVIVPDAILSDDCSVSGLTWSMAGATTATSSATGINQIGTYIFNTGITTVTYIIADEGGNTNTCSFTVTVLIPGPLSGTVSSQIDILCFGDNTGSVTVAGIDGQPLYEYSLDGGAFQPSGTFNALSAGAYTVTVRDALSTAVNVPVIISGPVAALTVGIVQTNVLCNGGNTGTATATVTGGTGPYNYSWNTTPVQTGSAATGLSAGTYTVTITDANNCPITENVTITQPSSLTVATTQTNVLCNGSADGTATAVPAGGIGPYTFSWDTSPVQTGITATGLAAGTYSVSVTDANNCTTSGNVSITEPSILSLDAVSTEAACPDSDDGSITLDISGGTAPYNVIWADPVANPVTTKDRTRLLPGTYNVVVTDANGCPAGATAEVSYTGSFDCLEFPDIITPEPADQHNDEWVIRNIDIYPNAEVLIYTRWGKLIYQTKNISANPWNGRYSNGKLVPTDSYHYILYLGDGSKPRSGVISVIR